MIISRVRDAAAARAVPEANRVGAAQGPSTSLGMSGGVRRLDLMRWGIPLPRTGKPVTNVRNLASPFWRSMLKSPARRCLVPVTDFCEWSGATEQRRHELNS